MMRLQESPKRKKDQRSSQGKEEPNKKRINKKAQEPMEKQKEIKIIKKNSLDALTEREKEILGIMDEENKWTFNESDSDMSEKYIKQLEGEKKGISKQKDGDENNKNKRDGSKEEYTEKDDKQKQDKEDGGGEESDRKEEQVKEEERIGVGIEEESRAAKEKKTETKKSKRGMEYNTSSSESEEEEIEKKNNLEEDRKNKQVENPYKRRGKEEMETIIPRINESGSNIIEDEDDVNTVDSDKTSIYHNGNKNKIILPKMTRYQLMISLDQHNDTFNPEEIEEIRSK